MMVVNGLQLPDAFTKLVRQGVTPLGWLPRDGVDAYGNEIHGDLEFFEDSESIKEANDILLLFLKVQSPEKIAQWTASHVAAPDRQPGFIPYIRDFSKIVCFGKTSSGAQFCFDFRENPAAPSVIYWADGYWRRVAPNFETFVALFAPDG